MNNQKFNIGDRVFLLGMDYDNLLDLRVGVILEFKINTKPINSHDIFIYRTQYGWSREHNIHHYIELESYIDSYEKTIIDNIKSRFGKMRNDIVSHNNGQYYY